MGLLVAICLVVVCAAVVLVISAPLRRHGEFDGPPDSRSAMAGGEEADDLQAAREAKYREIRDAELDYRTGKLSEQDFHAIDGQLRAEALAILDRLEDGRASSGATSPRDA